MLGAVYKKYFLLKIAPWKAGDDLASAIICPTLQVRFVFTKSRRRLKPKVASILLRTGLNLRFLVESKMRMKLKG